MSSETSRLLGSDSAADVEATDDSTLSTGPKASTPEMLGSNLLGSPAVLLAQVSQQRCMAFCLLCDSLVQCRARAAPRGTEIRHVAEISVAQSPMAGHTILMLMKAMPVKTHRLAWPCHS